LSLGADDSSSEAEATNTVIQVTRQNAEINCFYEYNNGDNESNVTSSFGLSANTWTHVAVVRSDADGQIHFYKNGVFVESETASNDPEGATDSNVNFRIGANQATNSFFAGKLAHVRVWDAARTASEIDYYYNRTVDQTFSNLQGYWKLDEGSGTSVTDSSSNNATGTINGSAQWGISEFDEYIHSFGLSYKDTTVSSNRYIGSVLNSIEIRDSIEITAGKASTSNISLTSANFKRNGTDIYKLLFNGTNNYHNKEVRVFAQYDNEDTLSNCQQIFSGRLVEISLNQLGNIEMQINSHRPWDKITFPQDQDFNSKIYVPTVYGDFTPNNSTIQTPADCDFKLYPVPVIDVNDSSIVTLMPRAYSGDTKSNINLHLDKLKFIPASHGSNYSFVDDTIVRGTNNVLVQPIENYRFVGIVPATENEPITTNILFTDAYKAFDRDDTTGATATFADTSSSLTLGFSGSVAPFYATLTQKIFVKFKYSISGSVDLFLESEAYTGSFGGTFSMTANTAQTATANITANKGNIFSTSNFDITFLPTSGESSVGTITVIAVTAQIKTFLFGKDGDNEPEDRQDSKTLGDIKYFYSGGDGLTASWDSDAILHGHDAHRDLLQRFAGIPSADPDNWSSLNTDRAIDNWKIRFYQLEPNNLKETLDKLAYEFGFCAKFSPSGNLKYIHIKKSSELSATLNLTKNDISKVNLSTSGLSNVIATMDINSIVNPADNNNYIENSIIENSTIRQKYNLGSKEGKKTINLDYIVGAIPSSADSDCNADWYSYYNNIVGDMKIIIRCSVTNISKGYQLETGDIITFTDMPVEMFGTDFSNSKYFMIVELQRSVGNVNIVAREVG
jgi:hypothetical protein